eukprot:1394048-Amorphochlora_amoeboformis.AAC.1
MGSDRYWPPRRALSWVPTVINLHVELYHGFRPLLAYSMRFRPLLAYLSSSIMGSDRYEPTCRALLWVQTFIGLLVELYHGFRSLLAYSSSSIMGSDRYKSTRGALSNRCRSLVCLLVV